jgi:hypothetical protein
MVLVFMVSGCAQQADVAPKSTGSDAKNKAVKSDLPQSDDYLITVAQRLTKGSSAEEVSKIIQPLTPKEYIVSDHFEGGTVVHHYSKHSRLILIYERSAADKTKKLISWKLVDANSTEY